jgi:hypothetical protein
MINIIPMYKDSPLKKTQASEKELKEIQNKLKTTTRTKRKQEQKSKENPENKKPEDLSKLPKLGFRIP